MFSTAKEVHVYVDGAIQQLSSNRKQSIAPQQIDMLLNNAVLEYISSRFPNGYNAKDIEGTLKRYTDFSNLKDSIRGGVIINDTEAYKTASVVKPHDALKIQSVLCSYIRPYSESNTTVDKQYRVVVNINENILSEPTFVLSSLYTMNGVSKGVNINFTTYLKAVKTKSGLFYLYDSMLDVLRNQYKLNARFNSVTTSGNKELSIEFPIGSAVIDASANSTNVSCLVESKLVRTSRFSYGRQVPCSIMPDFDAKVARADYYRSRNLHLDPIVEIDENFVNIHFTDFLPISATVYYIRKPKLFDITTGQIPEISITKDFLDYAVKEFYLLFNSNNFERVVNENIKNL